MRTEQEVRSERIIQKSRLYRFKTEVIVNRRKYELEFSQALYEHSGKIDEGVIEVLVKWRQGRYPEKVTLAVNHGKVRGRGRYEKKFAPSSLEKLKAEILRVIDENSEEIKKVTNNGKDEFAKNETEKWMG